MKKNTQGNWYIGTGTAETKIFSDIAGRTLIADLSMFSLYHPDLKEENEANAKLIAAAPELLEALQMLFKTAENMGMMLESKYWTEKFREEWNKTATKAEFAIQKATT